MTITKWGTWIKKNSKFDFIINPSTITTNAEIQDDISKAVEKETNEQYNAIVDKLRENLFTLFWVFASVVAFLLVEVQVLKSATSWQMLAWISLILLWALSFFVLLMKVVISSENSWKFWIWILFIISGIFILIWVYLASQWNEWQIWTIKYEKNFYSDIKYH